MKTCFFAIISDLYYYNAGGHKFVNSFKRFHPYIDLIVYRQDMIDHLIDYDLDVSRGSEYIDSQGNRKIPFFIAKAVFGKILAKKYEKVVHVDGDTVIAGRLTEVLKDDWEIGGVWNYNDLENASLKNVTEEMYIQCGMVGSTKPRFWELWEEANIEAANYPRLENDTLNLMIYNHPEAKRMKLKIFDKEKDYYGCKSLGREKEMYIENDELMLRNEKVKAYHHAKGPTFPKLHFPTMGFKPEVVKWLEKISDYGQSIKYGTL